MLFDAFRIREFPIYAASFSENPGLPDVFASKLTGRDDEKIRRSVDTNLHIARVDATLMLRVPFPVGRSPIFALCTH
jgi:hypothetical protein